MTDNDHWGEAAYGVSGRTDVSLLDALSGPERWLLLIENPQFSIAIEIATPDVVARFASFLEQAPNGDLPLGSFGDAHVRIIRDPDFTDRFFLSVTDGGFMRFTLTGDAIADLAAALRDAQSELDNS